MIAVPLTGPNFSRRQVPRHPSAPVDRESQRCGIAPADGSVAAQFEPPDPSILNEAIPAFFIGRNAQGFWVARDVKGRIGGVFLLESSALSFAKRNSEPAGCATIFPSERFELDLENSGNRLVVQIESLKRLAVHAGRRMASLIGKLAGAVKAPIAGVLRRLH
jgi:hypothetical protein